MSMTTDQATRDSGRTPTDSATTSVWRSRQQKTPKRVSDAMLSRITARVEALVRRRRGGAGLSGGERAQARADIELILQSSKPLSNRDLSLIAGRCCSSERSTPVLGDDGSTVSSVLPPVHTRRTDSSLPNAAGRPAAHLTPADIVSLNSAYRAPSSSCNNNNNYNNNITDDDESSAPERRHYLPSRPVDSSPPAEFHAGRAWALGIKSDVERFHKEQQEVRRAQKLRKNEHRSVLERQMEERRAAAARAREEELRCDAGGEEQRPEDEKLKRLQSDEFREDVLKANEAILHAKLATHRREVEEDQALAKAMAEQLAHDRQRDAMKKQDKRKKMEEMGELMKVRERSMLEIKMKAREQEKAASLKHLSLLEKLERDRSVVRQRRMKAFNDHQAVVDGMAGMMNKKGDQSWINLGDVQAERQEHASAQETLEQERRDQEQKRLQMVTLTKEGLDKQLAEKAKLQSREHLREQAVHEQLLRHLRRVEEKETMRTQRRRQLEREHKQSLDQQVLLRKLERTKELVRV